jgi:hypothetical protein
MGVLESVVKAITLLEKEKPDHLNYNLLRTLETLLITLPFFNVATKNCRDRKVNKPEIFKQISSFVDTLSKDLKGDGKPRTESKNSTAAADLNGILERDVVPILKWMISNTKNKERSILSPEGQFEFVKKLSSAPDQMIIVNISGPQGSGNKIKNSEGK